MAHSLSAVWLLAATCISLSVAGQLLLKVGMRRIVGTGAKGATKILLGATTSPAILLGILCFLTGTASWLLVLARVDLSWAYPLSGLSHVLITLGSWRILGEPVRRQRWLGVALVVGGVIVVGRS